MMTTTNTTMRSLKLMLENTPRLPIKKRMRQEKLDISVEEHTETAEDQESQAKT
jgi:hypothetical protein